VVGPLTRARDFIRLGRPAFLAGGFVFYGLGVAMARSTGAPLDLPALLWGQVAVIAIQLATQYSNEYFDLVADCANLTPTRWAGGSRVLPEKRLPPEIALGTALFMSLLALVAILVLALIARPGLLTAAMLLLALILAWGYSAPPIHLQARGLGELTTAFLVTGMTPLVGFYMQAGRLAWLPLLAVIPLCCMQFAMQLTIGFPDAAGDAVSGKHTLVVRLGGPSAARLHNLALLAAYVTLPILAWAGLPILIAVAASLGAPLAIWLMWRMERGDWARPACWNGLATWGIALLMATAALELIAFSSSIILGHG
jgi:1,4-dihydroxy-2-naphthoate polyprenyltransferase